MSGGWSHESFMPELCRTCMAAGREERLKEIVIHEPGLSAVIARCIRCGFTETRASAIGLKARAELLKARRHAKWRTASLVAIGALFALGMVVTAVALAAIK